MHHKNLLELFLDSHRAGYRRLKSGKEEKDRGERVFINNICLLWIELLTVLFRTRAPRQMRRRCRKGGKSVAGYIGRPNKNDISSPSIGMVRSGGASRTLLQTSVKSGVFAATKTRKSKQNIYTRRTAKLAH